MRGSFWKRFFKEYGVLLILTIFLSLLWLIIKWKVKQLDSVSSTNYKLIVWQIVYALLSVILIILWLFIMLWGVIGKYYGEGWFK